jgi:predicted transcriptional regulator
LAEDTFRTQVGVDGTPEASTKIWVSLLETKTVLDPLGIAGYLKRVAGWRGLLPVVFARPLARRYNNFLGYLLAGSGGGMRALSHGLGPLERKVIHIIWESEDCSVSHVAKRLSPRRAYTSVMTTLDRLYLKGILNRRMVGRKFLYSARLDPSQLEAYVARGMIDTVLAGCTERRCLISSLLYAIRRHDPRLFDETIAAIKHG